MYTVHLKNTHLTLVVQMNPKPNAISYLRIKNFAFFQTRFYFLDIHHFNQILCLIICMKCPVMTTKAVLYSLKKKLHYFVHMNQTYTWCVQDEFIFQENRTTFILEF